MFHSFCPKLTEINGLNINDLQRASRLARDQFSQDKPKRTGDRTKAQELKLLQLSYFNQMKLLSCSKYSPRNMFVSDVFTTQKNFIVHHRHNSLNI